MVRRKVKNSFGVEWLAVTAAVSQQLHGPGAPGPVRHEVLRLFLRPKPPGALTAVTDLVMRCGKWALTLPLELAFDLPAQELLVGFDAQQEGGPLFR